MSNRKRSRSISFRVSEAEFSYISKKVKLSKMPLREFILKSIKDGNFVIKEGGNEIICEIKRIGNNINQLAYLSNSHKINNCNQELQDIYLDLRRLMKKWQ